MIENFLRQTLKTLLGPKLSKFYGLIASFGNGDNLGALRKIAGAISIT